MSTDRKLAWLGLLVGLIGLIPVLHEASFKLSTLLVLLLVAVGSYLVYSEWQVTRSAMTTLELEKKVVIHDAGGTNSTLTRRQKIRANYAFLGEIWFRNMVTDGSFGPVTIDGVPPAMITRMGCLLSYSKRFTPPLSRGTVCEVRLTCDVADSFPSTEEGLLHEVAQDTRLLYLKVELPSARVCKTAALYLEAAGEPARELEKPEISFDRRLITSTIKMPITGYTYHLHWTW